MSSTVARKTSTRKRKPQARKRPAPARRKVAKKTTNKAANKAAPPMSIADWLAFGSGVGAVELPGWKELADGKNKRKNTRRRVRGQVDSLFEHVSTRQFALALMVAALGLGVYVSHVFATRDTLSFLEQQRRENLKLELQYNQLKGQLDEKISPNVVYRRAKELGLQEGLAFGPTIEWEMVEK